MESVTFTSEISNTTFTFSIVSLEVNDNVIRFPIVAMSVFDVLFETKLILKSVGLILSIRIPLPSVEFAFPAKSNTEILYDTSAFACELLTVNSAFQLLSLVLLILLFWTDSPEIVKTTVGLWIVLLVANNKVIMSSSFANVFVSLFDAKLTSRI